MGGCVAKQSRSKKKSAQKTRNQGESISYLVNGAVEEPDKTRSLQELHENPPPAFRKFEIEVPWRSIDEDIALQLWDVYKALYTF